MEEKFRVELLTMLDKRMSKEQISAVDMALTALFGSTMYQNRAQNLRYVMTPTSGSSIHTSHRCAWRGVLKRRLSNITMR